MFSYTELKARHREVREQEHENLRLRVHRALSWLGRAEQAEDVDARFIFLWIAFNAAYAYEIDERYRLSERATFRQFLEKLCALDTENRLGKLAWEEFAGPIRALLDTPWILPDFWQYQRGDIAERQWRDKLAEGKRTARKALKGGNTAALLGVLLQRIYTLRNQIMHGGATWNGRVNRQQLKDCAALLGKLMPVIISLMMENPGTVWGDPCYPVVKENP